MIDCPNLHILPAHLTKSFPTSNMPGSLDRMNPPGFNTRLISFSTGAHSSVLKAKMNILKLTMSNVLSSKARPSSTFPIWNRTLAGLILFGNTSHISTPMNSLDGNSVATSMIQVPGPQPKSNILAPSSNGTVPFSNASSGILLWQHPSAVKKRREAGSI